MPSHPCSAEDGETAAFLVTDLVQDVTMSLCLGHMVGYSSALVQAYAGADEGPEPDSHGEAETSADAPESDQADPEPQPARKRRTRPAEAQE